MLLLPFYAFSQSGQKWSTATNAVSLGDALGTSNNYPLNIKVNSLLKGSFTNDGLEMYGNIRVKKNAFIDSTLNAWSIIVADGLSVGGNAAITGTLSIGNKFFLNPFTGYITSSTGTVGFGGNNLKTSGDIYAANIFLQQNITLAGLAGNGKKLLLADDNGNIQPFPFSGNSNEVLKGDGSFGQVFDFNWHNTGNNLIMVPSGMLGIGTDEPIEKLDVNGNANIRGYLYVQDGVIIGKRIKSEKMETDTVFSKGIEADTIYSKQMNADKARITNIIIDGNNSKISSTSGVLYFENTNLYTSGQITSNNLNVSGLTLLNKLKTGWIVSPDSLIHFGDSSLIYNASSNQIMWNPGVPSTIRGLRIGPEGTPAYGMFSIAIGRNVGTTPSAINSIIIGGGDTFLENSFSNSLMVGFNSNIPTLTIRGASGINTIGKVGIGTSNPVTLLDVRSNNAQPADKIASFRNSENRTLFFVVKNVGGGYNGMGNDNDYAICWNDATGTNGKNGTAGLLIAPHSASNRGLLVDASGNVGIGTANPQSALAVNGKITATDVEVVMEMMPDYVFEENYPLISLSEMEQYIYNNKHLPGVPSAAEVKQNGLNLGDMDKILLEKVEELTLYLIEQNKKLEELKEENLQLKNRIVVMENK